MLTDVISVRVNCFLRKGQFSAPFPSVRAVQMTDSVRSIDCCSYATNIQSNPDVAPLFTAVCGSILN